MKRFFIFLITCSYPILLAAQGSFEADTSYNEFFRLRNDTLKIEIIRKEKSFVFLYQKNKRERKILDLFRSEKYESSMDSITLLYIYTYEQLSDSIQIKVSKNKLKQHIKKIVSLEKKLNRVERGKDIENCRVAACLEPLLEDVIDTAFSHYYKKNGKVVYMPYHSAQGIRLSKFYCNDKYRTLLTAIANEFYKMCHLPKVVPYDPKVFE